MTPHHLCLTDEAVRSLDPNMKMNPPLRTEADRLALVEGLRDGTLDCVATDHAPHARHEKEVPFEEAPFGVTGLETSFAVLHTDLVLAGALPLEILLERMSAGPARALGLPVPRIAVGAPANLVQLDLDGRMGGDARRASARCRSNSWLLGRTLRVRSSAPSRTGAWCTRPCRGGRMTAAHGYLALEDGTVLRGRSVGADGVAFGEAVFTTGMSGYQETVTDPSFAGSSSASRRRWSATTASTRHAWSRPRRTRRRCSCGVSAARNGRRGCTRRASSRSTRSTPAR